MMLLAEDAPEVLFFSTEIDGGRDFTPGEAEPIWPGEPFSGGGEGYLKFLTDTALPYLEAVSYTHLFPSFGVGKRCFVGCGRRLRALP